MMTKNLNRVKYEPAALAEQQFIPYFQPIHDITIGVPVGDEILARLILPDDKILPPAFFLHTFTREVDIGRMTRILLSNTASWLRNNLVPDGFNRLNHSDDLMLSKTSFTHSDLLRW
ncbi:TPA: EAL domain-containing protein [Salmonella enterica]|nr:EAL domain-containing protein [Salmonella enterica subsp. enterica serovar Miami]